MQEVKGSVLRSRLTYVEEHGGADAVTRVLGALAPEDQAKLKALTPIGWYPFEVGKHLDEAIVKVLGAGRPDFFEELGAASAQKNLTGPHKSFLAPGDPQRFLSMAPAIYATYYRTGRREYQRLGDKEGVLTTHDAETFSKPDCLTVVGWYRKALEMCGCTGVRVTEEECRALGGKVCRYRVVWE
jgi:uncharacterized protein (TIGR02265 family)